MPKPPKASNYGKAKAKANPYRAKAVSAAPDARVDRCSDNMTTVTALDQLYEQVLVLERQVDTGPSRAIINQYNTALTNFQNAYSSAPPALQGRWAPADTHVQGEIAAQNVQAGSMNTFLQQQQMRGGNFTGHYFVTTWSDGVNNYTRLEYVQQSAFDYVYGNGIQRVDRSLTVDRYTLSDQNSYQKQSRNHRLGQTQDERLCVQIMRQLGIGPFHAQTTTEGNVNYKWLKRHNDGIGQWYVTVKSPVSQQAAQPQIIDIPDYCDYGFEGLLQKFKEECGDNILTSSRADDLREEMADALAQQEVAIQNLVAMSTRSDDGIEELGQVWRAKMAFYTEMLEEAKKTTDCLKDPAECTDYKTMKDEYDRRCRTDSLPAGRAEFLVDGMIDCLNKDKGSITTEENKLIAAGTIGAADKAKFDKQRAEIDRKLENIRNNYSRDGCMPPVDLLPKFAGSTNNILNEADLKEQIEKEILPLFKSDDELKIKLTGHTGSNKAYDDQTYSGPDQDPSAVYNQKTGPEVKGGTTLGDYHNTGIDNTVLTVGTLMDLRVAAIKAILTRSESKGGFGISADRIIEEKRGTHGSSVSNRKVTVEFY